jgi:hypothetical protein
LRALNLLNCGRKLANFTKRISVRLLIGFGNLKALLFEDVIELAVQINFVTINLEVITNEVVVSVLFDEFLNLSHVLVKSEEVLFDPLLGLLVSDPDDFRDESLQLLEVFLGRWLDSVTG